MKMVCSKDVLFVKCVFTFLSCIVDFADGHGRLVDPPSRSTMWRYGFDNPPNYNDNELYCGGVQVQYGMNGGKCGVCGDPWQGPHNNEAGGKYANGIIVRKYDPGMVINVTVELTASHKGYFEFRLCPSNNPFKRITHECLNKFPLRLAGTRKTKYFIPENGMYQKLQVDLKLPKVKCRACVLQWKYNAGNSWGTDSKTGVGCMGCGNQEQFYGCADIAIGVKDVVIGQKPEKNPSYFDDDDSWHWGTVPEYDYDYEYDASKGSLVTFDILQSMVVPILIPFMLAS